MAPRYLEQFTLSIVFPLSQVENVQIFKYPRCMNFVDGNYTKDVHVSRSETKKMQQWKDRSTSLNKDIGMDGVLGPTRQNGHCNMP